jgi:hypothetical protein
MGKERATVVFRRLVSGEVLGEIVTESGEVAVSKSFGIMTEDEYRKILKLVEQENPDIGAIETIELSGN